MTAAATGAGPVLAAAWNDAALQLWHLRTGRVAHLPLPAPATSLALTPDARLLLATPDGARSLRLHPARLWE